MHVTEFFDKAAGSVPPAGMHHSCAPEKKLLSSRLKLCSAAAAAAAPQKQCMLAVGLHMKV